MKETLKAPEDYGIRETTAEAALPYNRMETVIGDGDGQKDLSVIIPGDMINDKYILERLLVEGTGESIIFICRPVNENKEYIAKIYYKNTTPKEEVINDICNINSPYVIKIIDHGYFKERYYEIQDYYVKGDIWKICGGAPLDPDLILYVLVPQMNEALRAIHKSKIIHRDVKPSNIFISNDAKNFVLGDFGISSKADAKGKTLMTGLAHTFGFSAPEAHDRFVSPASDYFSLGMTLLYLTAGDVFANMSDIVILKTTTSLKELSNLIEPVANKKLKKLIYGLTAVDRSLRWGFGEVDDFINEKEVIILNENKDNENDCIYSFGGRQVFSKKELALEMANNWNEARRHIKSGQYGSLILTHFNENAGFYGQSYVFKVEDCCNTAKENIDRGIFELIYTLYEDAPFCFLGRIFENLTLFGKAMASFYDPNLMLALEEEYLQYYAKIKRMDYKFIDQLNDILKISEKNRELAYYALMYVLCDINEYYIDGRILCKSLEGLIQYLAGNVEKWPETAKSTLNDPGFFAWLYKLGYYDSAEKFYFNKET